VATKFDEKNRGHSDLRFVLLSSHDSTLSMLLSALGLPQSETPPFASAVFFELWSSDGKQFVKLIYNDNELDLYKYCHGASDVNGTKKCEYEVF